MSNFRKLIIPAVVLVLLVGVYLIVTNLPEKEDENNTAALKKELRYLILIKTI